MIGKAKLLFRHILIGKLDVVGFEAITMPLRLIGG